MARFSNRTMSYTLILITVVLVLLDIGGVAKVDATHFTALATIIGLLLGARHKQGDVRGSGESEDPPEKTKESKRRAEKTATKKGDAETNMETDGNGGNK